MTFAHSIDKPHILLIEQQAQETTTTSGKKHEILRKLKENAIFAIFCIPYVKRAYTYIYSRVWSFGLLAVRPL